MIVQRYLLVVENGGLVINIDLVQHDKTLISIRNNGKENKVGLKVVVLIVGNSTLIEKRLIFSIMNYYIETILVVRETEIMNCISNNLIKI